MITIISGTPGAGKTALIIDMMIKELRNGRKIFTIGIPKLLLNVLPGGDSHKWQDGSWLAIDKYAPALCKQAGIKSTWFPRGCPEDCRFLHSCLRLNDDDMKFSSLKKNPCGVAYSSPDAGALIVIDESHIDFPQRASGKAPPPCVEALTTHRHQGLDFWFVSQRPSFLDPFIRGLSSRHIHLSLNPFSFIGNRNKYEWTEYQETVTKSSKLLAAKSDYRPSPAVFPLYASASVHTKLERSMPTIMKVFILVCLVAVVAASAVYYRVNSRVQAISSSEAVGAGGGRSQTAALTGSGFGSAVSAVVSASGVPVSVPVVVAVVPNSDLLLSACMATSVKCQCYDNRGVKIALSDFVCRESSKSVNERFNFTVPVVASSDIVKTLTKGVL